MSNALLGGHPDTCDLAAACVAVVEMHVMEVPGVHDEKKASRGAGIGQLSVEFAWEIEVLVRETIAFLVGCE